MSQQPSPEVAARLTLALETSLGRRPLRWRPVVGGYTSAERWAVDLDDGTSVFTKAADGAWTARWLRAERSVLEAVTAPFAPRLRGWHQTDGLPVMLLEDLSRARWPRGTDSWRPGDEQRVLNALHQVAETPAPESLRSLEQRLGPFDRWRQIAEAPTEFLSTSLCTASWLSAALPSLCEAEANVIVAGNSLLHLDVRSDNLCFVEDGSEPRAVFVDWNWACRGEARVDVAFWLPSLANEGGSAPWELLPNAPDLAALVAGYFCTIAGRPTEEAGQRIRRSQRAQARHALGWAARELGLSAPVA